MAYVKQSLVTMALLAVATVAGLAADFVPVSQRGRRFSPDALVLAPGATVRIANDDRVSHHVFVDEPDMKFDSGEQSVGTDVTLRFDREGRFAIRCAIHPTMHLEVTVDHAASP
jgi:plastocyanin